MSFGGRFIESLYDFEENLKHLNNYEKPYRNSMVHFNEKSVLKQLKKIQKLTEKTIKEIEKQLQEKVKDNE